MKTKFTFLLLIVLVMAGCGKGPVTIIYVTPTPDPAASLERTEVPTVSREPGGIVRGDETPYVPTPKMPEPTPTIHISTEKVTPAPSETPDQTQAALTLFPVTDTPIPPTQTPTPEPPTATPPPTHTFTPSPTPGPSPTPLPALQSSLLGMQVHPFIGDYEMQQSIEKIKLDLGMKWVKYQVEWSLMTNEPGHYSVEFQIMERYIQHAHNNGMNVLLSVVNAPDWAIAPDVLAQGRDGSQLYLPADFNHYAAFVGDIAWRFENRVQAIEIWNEPNLSREWAGGTMGASEYMRLLRASYEAIKQSNPNMIVVSAALAPTGDSEWSIDDRAFLRSMYENGLARYSDAVGVHPYGWGNPPDATCCDMGDERGWDDKPQFFFLDTLNDTRAIMNQYGDQNKQMWITEIGWASPEGFAMPDGSAPPLIEPWYGYISAWNQAHYTVRAIEIAQQRGDIGLIILWNYHYSTFHTADDPVSWYSFIDPNWNPRPVYKLIQMAPKK